MMNNISYIQKPYITTGLRDAYFNDVYFDTQYKYAIPLNVCNFYDVKNGCLIQRNSIIQVINGRIELKAVNTYYDGLANIFGFIESSGVVNFTFGKKPELTFLLCNEIPSLLPTKHEKPFSCYCFDPVYQLYFDTTLFDKSNFCVKATGGACIMRYYYLNHEFDETLKRVNVITLAQSSNAALTTALPRFTRSNMNTLEVPGFNLFVSNGAFSLTGDQAGFIFSLNLYL